MVLLNTGATCPTCGSNVVWPCLNRPCSEMTAPDPFHARVAQSTGDVDVECNHFATIAKRASMARWEQEDA